MRNIVLSLIVVAVLVTAGMGGAFAGFSDSEVSKLNKITTGSLDLKVNGGDDQPWGTGVDTIINVVDVMPSKLYVANVTVANYGQAKNPDGSNETAYLYLHLKNMCCLNIAPLHDGYQAKDGSGMKPEPELVAEYGGWVDQHFINAGNATGKLGDNCSLRSHIDLTIEFDGVPVDISAYDLDKNGAVTFIEIVDIQVYIGELDPCGADHTVSLIFHLQQIEDPLWETRVDEYGTVGVPEKFKDWPTNALMLDQIVFDIEFDLLQEPVQQ